MPSVWSWYQIVEARFGVRVLEGGEAGPPRRRRSLAAALPCEEVVPGALGGVAGRDVVGRRQVPRLGVAVALVADADRAVHVGDHRAPGRCTRPGVVGERRARVAAGRAARRVGPVQRRVDRQQVRQVVAVGVLQVVDPLHPHRRVPPAPRWSATARCGCSRPLLLGRRHGAVAPDRGRRAARGQDLLRELPHRDLVVVDLLAALGVDGAGLGHHRRDQQRGHELAIRI